MQNHLVITLAGPDRIGIVDRVTEIVLRYQGNIEESRMARLGGEFAMIMLISIPTENTAKLKEDLSDFEKDGFQILTRKTVADSEKFRGWLPYTVQVQGADHEGIINSMTHDFAARGINIESLTTGSFQAPMSGTCIFSMEAIVYLPPDFPVHEWKKEFMAIAESVNVDAEVVPYKG
jgi:glycine cleavage system transcriptional repressor